MRERIGTAVVLYAAVALAVFPVFPHFLSPNEVTRWATAAAIVEGGTPEVSSVLPMLGSAFEDLSARNGRVFSNKAPGGALAALPGYLVARPLVGPPSALSLRPTLVAMRLFGATLPLLFLGMAFRGAALRAGATRQRTDFAAAMLLFATPLFAYGLLLFAHAIVAACLFGAWIAFFPRAGIVGARRDLIGGALLGLAVLSEYPAAVPAAVLVVCATVPAPRRLVAIAAGGAPFAGILALANAISFGSPFALSSAFEVSARVRTLRVAGLFGIGLPSPALFLRLLFDPSHGLLVFSPFLLLWPLTLRAVRSRLSLPAAAALTLAPVSLFVVYAGFPDWHGGFNVGPRYVVPALPFLLFPFAFREGGRLETALAGASVLACVGTTLAFPFVPLGFALPWGTLAGNLYGMGLTVPNVLHMVWPPAALAIPAAAMLAAAVSLSLFRLKTRAVAFCAGVVIAAAAALVAPRLWPLSPSLVLQRAYIADVYFGRRGALEKAIAETGAPQPRLLARRERELSLPPAPWPF